MLNLIKNPGYSPFLSHLVVTRKCNLSCGYCSEYDKTSEPVPVDLLKKRIDKLQDLGSLIITFTGGEPFMHPHMIDLIRYAKPKFFERTIITNSYLLDEDKVVRLNKAGLTGMQISIDGVSPNAVTIKVLKPLKKKIEMISKKAKFMININSVIGASTPNEVMEVVDFARKLGLHSTIQMIHDHNGQIKISEDERVAYEKVKRLVRPPVGSFLYAFTEKLMYEGKAYFKCRGGSRYLYVDEFGNVHWCSQTRNRFTKPLMDYTRSDLKEQFYVKKGCEARCTIGCVRTSSWFDEWRRYG